MSFALRSYFGEQCWRRKDKQEVTLSSTVEKWVEGYRGRKKEACELTEDIYLSVYKF